MRATLLALGLLFVIAPAALAEGPQVEKYLHTGKLAEGERALERLLETEPGNDEARFGLGTLRFVRAIERFGQSLYEHGVKSEDTSVPFLRIPVPANPDPTPLSHPQLRRYFMQLTDDLALADATLAEVKSPNVKLRLRLASIRLDLKGDGQSTETLLAVLKKLMRTNDFPFLRNNPDFIVCFDRGDVAWLRAYCHLLSAMADLYLAFDTKLIFDNYAHEHFAKPKGQTTPPPPIMDYVVKGIPIVEPRRLHTCRLHLVKVCELNQETWLHIRAETDNDYEWLPNAQQDSVFGMRIRAEQVDTWLTGMNEFKGMLNGEKILDINLTKNSGYGVNLRTFFDHPPAKLDLQKIMASDIDLRYLEFLTDKNRADTATLWRMLTLFDGPLSFAYMAWMN